MSRLVHLIIFLYLAASIGCGGGNSDSSDRLSKLAASTSLRIGRSANSSSPVATSAALSNGETVIVIFDPLTGKISEVLFKNQQGQVIRIVVDPSGRPRFAETNDTRISFSNFADNASDVLIEQNGIAVGSLNVPFQEETISLLQGNQILANVLGIDQADQDKQRGFLNSAVIAVRTVGCAGRAASSTFSVSSSFSDLSSSACSSQILDEIVNVTTDETQNLSEITVTNIPDNGNCNNSDSLAGAQKCTEDFGGKIEEASQKGVVGKFPTPTPKPKPKPDSKPPSKDAFFGRWEGFTSEKAPTTTCGDGTIFFDITPNGDSNCASPNCLLAGMVVEQGGINIAINGVFNENDDLAFIGTSNVSGAPTNGNAIGHLDASSLSGSGSYQNDRGCAGTFNVTKQPNL